ncbi:amino acid transporter [Salinibacterium sp. CAN_S4]|uniref:APC family permease n=1 Tax=Salinibacterium sp. CAN_S4 TaxID=2787727 RepID=UPI0018F0127D
MTTTSEPKAESEAPTRRGLSGSLGVGAIVLMVVAAASPLTVIGGSVPLGILLGNGVGFPALFAASAIVLLLFSVGLAAMTKKIPKPGGFFTFVGYGLGKPSGLATAYVALLAYTTIQVAVYGYLGFLLSTTVAGLGGPEVAWWLYALATSAIVGLLGYRHIDLSSKVLGVLLIGEVLIVLALVAAVVFGGSAPEGLSVEPFLPTNIFSGTPGVGLIFAIAAFIGFESTVIFRDEARDPDRTIPRATYTAVIGIGVFYTLASWGIIMAWGPTQVVGIAAENPGAMVITTTLNYLGPIGEIIINTLLITSMFACVLSFHNVITRYQYSMSNAKLLPGRLGDVHSKHLSPHFSSLAQTAVAGILIVVFAILGLDPVLAVFTWFSGIATLAVAILMAATSLAVIVYFARSRSDSRPWNTMVAPALGLVGLVGAAVIIFVNFPFLVGDVNAEGVPVFGVVSTVLIGLLVVCIGGGYLQAYLLKRRDPASYEQITEAISG